VVILYCISLATFMPLPTPTRIH